MNHYTADLARNLDYKSRRIKRLALDRSPDAMRFWEDVAEALNAYPAPEAPRLLESIRGFDRFARGAWWELYLNWQIRKHGASVTIEYSIPETGKSIDFLATYPGGRSLIEATTSAGTVARAVQDIEFEVMAVFDELDCTHGLLHVAVLNASSNYPDLVNLEAKLVGWTKQASTLEHLVWADVQSGWELSIRRQALSGQHNCSGKSGCVLQPFTVPAALDASDGPADLVQQLRESVSRKREKITEAHAAEYVIAIAHDSDFVANGVFTQFSTLFGRPGIEIDTVSDFARQVIVDRGSFFDSEEGALVAGVLFGTGHVYGFTALRLPTFWMNPRHAPEINPATFPIEASFVRLVDDHLERLESNHSSADWVPISLY